MFMYIFVLRNIILFGAFVRYADHLFSTMVSIDEALAEVKNWLKPNKTLGEHRDYDKYRKRMDGISPIVTERSFNLLLEAGYDIVSTRGKEDTIVPPTTEADEVAMAERRADLLETRRSRMEGEQDWEEFIGSWGDEEETLADAAALTTKKSKTMPKQCDYLGDDYVQVRYEVAQIVAAMEIHITTDPQVKAKMKKVLSESVLKRGGPMASFPGYNNKKDLQKNYNSMFNYILNGVKYDGGEYDPLAVVPDFDTDEYNVHLLRKLSHTIMQQAAAAEKKVADAAAKKAKTKEDNELGELHLGLRTGAKSSGSGLGEQTSSRAHSVTTGDADGFGFGT